MTPMCSRSTAAVLIAFVVTLMTVTAAADAQIYSWRDADGALVVSDRPPSPEVTTVSVAGTTRIRTTRPVTRVEGAAQYDTLIRHHATQQGVRADLVRAVIQVESGFDPHARSPVGALGLMQLMPETARELGVVDPFDPGENVRGGVTYLRQLLTRYDGDETLALAAYNAGPGTVSRSGNTVPPYPETLAYLSKIGASGRPGHTARRDAEGLTIYKTYETVGGRRVPAYSNIPPASGEFEVATSGR